MFLPFFITFFIIPFFLIAVYSLNGFQYKTGEHDYIYETDSNGNIISAHASELKLKKHSGRLKNKTKTPGKLAGDNAGHLFADEFGGSKNLDNLVSMRSDINQSVTGKKNYRSMEIEWSKALKSGKKVTDVDIQLSYPKGSSRPSSFNITYKIDGKIHNQFFKQ